MHQQIIELLCNKDKHIIVLELLKPVLVFVDLLVVFTTYMQELIIKINKQEKN